MASFPRQSSGFCGPQGWHLGISGPALGPEVWVGCGPEYPGGLEKNLLGGDWDFRRHRLLQSCASGASGAQCPGVLWRCRASWSLRAKPCSGVQLEEVLAPGPGCQCDAQSSPFLWLGAGVL